MVSDSAGDICQIAQCWPFDGFVIEVLTKHGLFPGYVKPAQVDARSV